MVWLRGLFRKDLCRNILSHRMNLNDIVGGPTRFWGYLYQHKHYQLGLKKVDEMKEGSDPQNSTSRKQADETTQLRTYATFHEKGRMTQRVELQARRIEPHSQRLNIFQALKPKKKLPSWISKLLGIGGSLFLPFSPLFLGNIYNCFFVSVLPLYFGRKLLVF